MSVFLVVWAWATHFSCPRKISRVLCGYVQRRVQFEGCVAERPETISAFVLQDAMTEVTQTYPPLKLKVFVDDITALLKGERRDIAELAKKVMKKLKEEVEKKSHKMSVTENGKEGKSTMIASCRFLENELRQFSREEGVTLADSVETLGVDLRTRVKKAGSKRKSKEEKVQCEVLTNKEDKANQKSHMKVGCKQVAACRCDASKDLWSPCSGDVFHGEV